MANNGNEFLPNYVEYICPLQERRFVLPKKLLIVGGALSLCAIVLFVVSFWLQFLGGLVPVMYILIAFGAWYLWRFAAVEHEYTILQGEISFDAIYGKRQRKTIYTAKISAMEIIAPVVDGRPPEIAADRTIFAACRFDCPNTWYATVRETDGTQTLIFFEVYDKTLKTMRFFNPRAFRN